jgi:hypothetical protein
VSILSTLLHRRCRSLIIRASRRDETWLASGINQHISYIVPNNFGHSVSAQTRAKNLKIDHFLKIKVYIPFVLKRGILLGRFRLECP